MIPVGGGSIFSDEANINVVGDFENVQDTLLEMRDTAGKYKATGKDMYQARGQCIECF